jgi:organic radical activating enzyme
LPGKKLKEALKTMSFPNASVNTYPVMETFYTLQGEGYHQGKAAYFIRLGGCDVGCVWCDVKESWDPEAHPIMTVENILENMNGIPPSIAVITGGEPLMHELSSLTKTLQKAGWKTHIETSGAHPLSGSWDWICLSPKKFKAPLPSILPEANELKVVIHHKSDFSWAEQYAAMAAPICKKFLQPEWGRKAEMTPLIIDYIKEHPQWEFSLQLHKYIDVP